MLSQCEVFEVVLLQTRRDTSVYSHLKPAASARAGSAPWEAVQSTSDLRNAPIMPSLTQMFPRKRRRDEDFTTSEDLHLALYVCGTALIPRPQPPSATC